MISLLMIADDFTGALDSGVQFAKAGLKVRVVTDLNYELENAGDDTQVLVFDTESRHMDAKEAYNRVYQIARKGAMYGVKYIFKKTDSGLRGNLGSELQAILDATEEAVMPFFPSFPKMKRITKEGIHYIDGIKVQDSVFGADPFEPVKLSYIPDIIGLQSKADVKTIKLSEKFTGDEKGIVVFDAMTDEDLSARASTLFKMGKLNIMSGCAGLASIIPDVISLKGKINDSFSIETDGMLVVCGSVNAVTKAQIKYAENNGFTKQGLTPREKTNRDFWSTEDGLKSYDKIEAAYRQNNLFIIDSNDPEDSSETKEYMKSERMNLSDLRQRIPESLAVLTKKLLRIGDTRVLDVTGGDTLAGLLNEMGIGEMEPKYEVFPGSVLSRISYEGRDIHIISKSGGFGDPSLLVDIAALTKK